jgi:hydrogenase 3 maturation protease
MEKKKMLPGSWKDALSQLLERPTVQRASLPRIAILGIGNPLRSDDAAGVLVARRLGELRLIQDLHFLFVLDGGHAPENSTAKLRRFGPDIVLLIDAAQMGEAPGTIRWIDMEDLDGLSASTHSLPLSMLAKYLSLELGCEVKLLGIQPRSNKVAETVSYEALQAIEEIVAELITIFERVTVQSPV